MFFIKKSILLFLKPLFKFSICKFFSFLWSFYLDLIMKENHHKIEARAVQAEVALPPRLPLSPRTGFGGVQGGGVLSPPSVAFTLLCCVLMARLTLPFALTHFPCSGSVSVSACLSRSPGLCVWLPVLSQGSPHPLLCSVPSQFGWFTLTVLLMTHVN